LVAVAVLTGIFKERLSGQGHANGHVHICGGNASVIVQYLLMIAGSRSVPGNILPRKDIRYRKLLNESREVCQPEHQRLNRGPFEHQGIHHVRGGTMKGDICKITASYNNLTRVNSEDPLKFHHRLQKYFLARQLFASLFFLQADALGVALKFDYIILHFQIGEYFDALWATAGVCYDCITTFIGVFLPLSRGVFPFLLARLCAQYLNNFLLFYAQHRWHINYTPEVVNSDWGRYNADTCYSLWGENMKWHPILLGMGGHCPATLTYHLEHSLFPGVNYLYLSKVARVVEAVCKEYGYEYHKIGNYTALKNQLTNHLIQYSKAKPDNHKLL